jgi:glycogen synthase
VNYPVLKIPDRILMTADPIGGVWSYALELIRAFEPYQIEVVLATMGARLDGDQRKEVAGLSNVQLYESAFKLEWMQEPWQDVARAGEWLLQLEEKTRPKVIHLNGYGHGFLPWSAPKLIVGHSCVCSWWRAVKKAPPPSSWETYRKLTSLGLRAAELVIAPSQAMLNELRQFYGGFGQGKVISNGRCPTLFAPRTKENFILCAGRLWDEAKNIGVVAKIAGELPWPVYVAGDRCHPENGAERELENVSFLGRLSHSKLAVWYGMAGIYVLPARYEPFGLSVLEAALSGCALVLGDIPSLRENWDEAALFVPPDDPVALEAALLSMISRRGMMREMAGRARGRALEFTPQRMAEAYLSAYSQILMDQVLGEGREVAA